MNCGRCGAVLNAPNQPNLNQPFGNQQQSFNQPMPAMIPKKSGVGKILGIVGVSILALGLIGGLLIFLLVMQTTQ